MTNHQTLTSHLEKPLFPDTEKLYDLEILEQMEDTDYTIQVLKIYLKDSNSDLGEMKAAIHNGDMEMVAKKAHKLKGSVGIIQAYLLVEYLTEIERIAKEKSLNTTLKSLFENTLNHFNVTGLAIKKHLDSLSAKG